jgi:hypothetical protein
VSAREEHQRLFERRRGEVPQKRSRASLAKQARERAQHLGHDLARGWRLGVVGGVAIVGRRLACRAARRTAGEPARRCVARFPLAYGALKRIPHAA